MLVKLTDNCILVRHSKLGHMESPTAVTSTDTLYTISFSHTAKYMGKGDNHTLGWIDRYFHYSLMVQPQNLLQK